MASHPGAAAGVCTSTAQAPASRTPSSSDALDDVSCVPHLPLPTLAECSRPLISMSDLVCKVLQEGSLHIDQVQPEFKAQHAVNCHRSQQILWAAVLPSGVISK